MTIRVDPKKTALLLLKIALALLFLNIFGQIIGNLLEPKSGSDFLEFAQKQSGLRLYTTLLLVFCSALFLLIGLNNKEKGSGKSFHWMGLCVIFFFLAIAKDTSLDEQFSVLLQSLFDISRSVVYFIAYGIAFILIPALYIRFILQLPRRTLYWFIAGSITFLAGAFIFDLVTAYIGKILDHRSIAYIGSSAIEIFLETSGIIILIFTLLSHLLSELNIEKLEIQHKP